MAIPNHVKILQEGADAWNQWRIQNPDILPYLSGADFSGAKLVDISTDRSFGSSNLGKHIIWNLIGIEFRGINFYNSNLGIMLRGTNLRNAMLVGADLSKSDLSGAILSFARCRAANFRSSKLLDAILEGSDFTRACLEDADLSRADLTGARLVDTDMTGANLVGTQVYGISARNLRLNEAKQSDLIITRKEESKVTVDDVKLAQFTSLLLEIKEIRNVIDMIGKKVVLILGRLPDDRKTVLDAIRNKLRELGFVPVMFDFQKPTQRDFTETIKTLAGISRFIVTDITNTKSAPLEL